MPTKWWNVLVLSSYVLALWAVLLFCGVPSNIAWGIFLGTLLIAMWNRREMKLHQLNMADYSQRLSRHIEMRFLVTRRLLMARDICTRQDIAEEIQSAVAGWPANERLEMEEYIDRYKKGAFE